MLHSFCAVFVPNISKVHQWYKKAIQKDAFNVSCDFYGGLKWRCLVGWNKKRQHVDAALLSRKDKLTQTKPNK
jgi:hypothetical protein